MPSSYLIHPSRRLVYARLWGHATVEDVQALRVSVSADANFDATFDVLFDMGDADLTLLLASGIQRLATTTTFHPSARRAIVADTAVKFGVARMFEIRRDLAGGLERIEIVQTVQDALAWLGLTGFDPRLPSP